MIIEYNSTIEDTDLKAKKLFELRFIAAQKGLKYCSNLRKNDLIYFILKKRSCRQDESFQADGYGKRKKIKIIHLH